MAVNTALVTPSATPVKLMTDSRKESLLAAIARLELEKKNKNEKEDEEALLREDNSMDFKIVK